MTTKGAQVTKRKDSEENGHPATCDELTRMMENCGCGPMIAKMMAARMAAGSPEDGAKEQGEEPKSAEQVGRDGWV